ncbi:MAG TPA: UDP-N-acetylglucosamine--LPS N-acetylglucosamine transferase [Micromonosporaceae bacterium]|jgi:UDP-N-acetylglucosamine:LPS N-acetylglucosamine transferase
MGSGPGRVVIVSAGVGAGHDGSTAELARRLAGRGFAIDQLDFMDLLPGPSGSASLRLYNRTLNHAPWVYAGLFEVGTWSAVAALTRSLLAPARSRLLSLLSRDVRAVVSTYSLASQLLGPLRRTGRLRVPAITYVTDFAVHRQWVVPGVDALLAPHQVGVVQARVLGASAGSALAAGALVAPGFRPPTPAERIAARAAFGLPRGRLALVAAGSWGVGRVAQAAAEIRDSGIATPVVVCGRNAHLRERLARAGLPALGWVDDMPTLMKAVDVLVENAGGLMALEGMATGLPIATYRPIPGHGTRSAATLEQAGVSRWIRHPGALRPTLVRLMDGDLGDRQRTAAAPMLGADPAEVVAQLARPTVNGSHLVPRSWASRREWRSMDVESPTIVAGEP